MAISAELIDDFLNKLNDDEEFRSRLVNDTAAVLDEMGVEYNEEDLVDPSEVQLPSVGEVNENREAFREALFPDDGFQFHMPFFKLPPTSD